MSRLLASAIVGIGVFSSVSLASRNATAKDEDELVRTHGQRQDPWQTIQFSAERKITAVRLVLKSMRTSPWSNTGIAGEDGIDVTLKDSIILQTVQDAFRAPISWGIADDSSFQMSQPGYPVGSMHVSTNDGDFEIGICTGGFFLRPEVLSMRYAFYSWLLAQQIDDVVYDRTRTHLPLDVFQMLSGEWIVPAQRRHYYWLRRNHLIKQAQQIEGRRAHANQEPLQKQGAP